MMPPQPGPQSQQQAQSFEGLPAPTGPAQGGGQPPPPNPELQKAQQQLQQIEQQLTQIQENKQVLQLLRDEKTRGYRIEIETDSTIEPDEQAEKKSRIEFTEITGKFLGEALPILQVMPQAAPLFEQAMLFLVRGFRAGREMEDTIETVMQQIGQAAQQPKPSPEMMKLQAEMQQADQQHQQKMQQADQQHQQAMQLKAAEGQQKMALEQAKIEAHNQQHAATMQAAERQGQMAEEQHGRDLEAKQEDRQTVHETKQLEFQGMDREQRRADDGHAKEMERGDQQHGMKMKEQSATGVQEGAAEIKKDLGDALKAIAEANKLLAKAMSAPRKVIRDKTGRATGSETVMQ